MFAAKSLEHRVPLLELYTSEGCSSCPPADKFLSGLRRSGVKTQQLIPLAFHVTYWDYIGWKDPYGSGINDDRQREIARFDKRRSIYTPQFVLNGSDYRGYDTFNEDIKAISSQPAKIAMVLNVEKTGQLIKINLQTDSTKNDGEDSSFYITIYENRLVSDVKDGENQGVTLNHDYVVRKIFGPLKQAGSARKGDFRQVIKLDPQWKQQDLGIVAFAQNPVTGEVLQAVELVLF